MFDWMSDEQKHQWRTHQSILRQELPGQRVASVSTEDVDGFPEILAIVTLEDGTELRVTNAAKPGRRRAEKGKR